MSSKLQISPRLREIVDRKKSDLLTQSETLELEAIGELDDIFSYINATMANHSFQK